MSLNQISLFNKDRFPEAFEEIRLNGEKLKDYPEFSHHRFLVTQAVSSNGLALRYASPVFQEDRRIVLKALHQNPLAKAFIGPSLKEDKEISRIARREMQRFRTEHQAPKEVLPPKPKEKTVFISHADYFDYLQAKQKDDPQTQFLAKIKETASPFLRDSHVTLPSGTDLIPYPIQDLFFIEQYQAILPPSANHFIIAKTKTDFEFPPSTCGNGFIETNVDQAIIHAQELSIPYKLGSTCIEGGNCFVFHHHGIPKAIIGELSIYPSFIALEQQGYFKDKAALVMCEGEPSLEAYRMARNLSLYEAKKTASKGSVKEFYRDPEAEFEYRKSLIAPVTAEEKKVYALQAKEIQGKLKLTREKIASELEIPLEHITFIPQREFHIDLELFITPDGEVVLHDDQHTRAFLTVLKKEFLYPEEKTLVEHYLKTAKEKCTQTNAVKEKTKEILETAGFKVHLLPAVFTASEEKSALNYCNGIFLRKTTPEDLLEHVDKKRRVEDVKMLYVTTGPSRQTEQRVHRRFTEVFQKIFPQLELCSLPGMSSFLAKNSGGIHCLTYENTLIN